MVSIQEAQKDPLLFDKFIEENLPLVHSVVRRFCNSTEYDDFFQCGCMGLVLAAKRFKPEFGNQFSTYAVPMINGSIRRYRRDYGTGIKVSRQIKDLYSKIYYYRNKGYSDEEICKELNITMDEIAEANKACSVIYSLNEPLGENDNGEPRTLEETLSSDVNIEVDVAEKVMIADKLEILKNLLPKEYYQVFVFYLQGKAQIEIGKRMGVSQVQVSRTIRSIKALCDRINSDYEAGKKTHENRSKYKLIKMREVVKVEEVKFSKSVAEELLKDGASPDYIASQFAHQFSGSTRVPKALMVKWGLVESKNKDKAKNTGKKKGEKKPGIVSLKVEALAGKEFKYELGENTKIIKGEKNVECEDLGRLIQELQEIQRMRQVG